MPRMRFPQDDWDNQSTEVLEDARTQDACRAACEGDHACVQWMFDSTTETCKVADNPRLGEASLGSGIHAEWIFNRVERWRDALPACHGETFITPEEGRLYVKQMAEKHQHH